MDGRVYDMTPAPSTKHQQATGQVHHLLRSHLSAVGHSCRAFIAPTDVVLAEDQVVQPDVFVICDLSKVKEAAVFGAPDVVCEVLSAGTEMKDCIVKMEIYERFEVLVYYLVHPDLEYMEEYVLTDGSYGRPRFYRENDTFSIETIGLELRAKDLFVF